MKEISENRIREMATEYGIFEDQGRNPGYYKFTDGIRAASEELGDAESTQTTRNCQNCKYLNIEDYPCDKCDDSYCMWEPEQPIVQMGTKPMVGPELDALYRYQKKTQQTEPTLPGREQPKDDKGIVELVKAWIDEYSECHTDEDVDAVAQK